MPVTSTCRVLTVAVLLQYSSSVGLALGSGLGVGTGVTVGTGVAVGVGVIVGKGNSAYQYFLKNKRIDCFQISQTIAELQAGQ